MDKTRTIIIIALIAVIVILSGLIITNFMKEPTKTVELFENGTTIDVPTSTHLENHDELSSTYITGKNTTIIGLDNNDLAGALASKILSGIIVDKGERQDNGLYKLDESSIMEMGDQLGFEYDEDTIGEVYVGIKHNNTVNQTVLIIGNDENEMIDILNSINWKLGLQKDTTDTVDATPSSSTSSNEDDKTFPFYADDGSLVGYYHVGDVVEHYGGLYQLNANGEWIYIGEVEGSSEAAYDRGYADAIDETTNDNDEYEDSSDSDL